MTPVRIGILGFGTVGSGTWNVLAENSEEIARRTGRPLEVIKVAVKNPDKPRDISGGDVSFTDDPYAVVDCPDVDIVLELIGGTEPVREYVQRALTNGKHVVTANKELLATHGNELFRTAEQAGRVIAYEASVCGGIPIIKALREGLAANRIESLVGVINGTSNYILSGMKENQCSFAEMLGKAQQLGYAEADPTFDVEGIDALHKLNILASIAFGIPLQRCTDVYCEGIGAISVEDIAFATELGYCIKPLAVAKRSEHGVEMRVHPSLISEQRLLAKVNGVMNAVSVTGNAVGRMLYYGAGAGAQPTASAVIADLVDVVRTLDCDSVARVPHLAFQPDALAQVPLLPIEQTKSANYLRIQAINQAGVLAEITRILGEHEISIESILQHGSEQHEEILPVVIVTQETMEENMQIALKELEELDTVIGKGNRIRIESLD